MTTLMIYHVGVDRTGRRHWRMRPLAAMLCLRRHHRLKPGLACVHGLRGRPVWRNRLQREQHGWAMFQLREDRQLFLAAIRRNGRRAAAARCGPSSTHPAGEPTARLI